jgi:hypothetical protein
VDVYASCHVSGNSANAVGCSFSDAYVEAFAQAAIGGWAEAWAEVTANSSSSTNPCMCLNEAEVHASIKADFEAQLFAQAQLEATADLLSGNECVTQGFTEKGAWIHCLAASQATLITSSVAKALVEGDCATVEMTENCEPVCHEWNAACDECVVHEKLRTNAFASALAQANSTVNPGYCTGDNKDAWYGFKTDAVCLSLSHPPGCKGCDHCLIVLACTHTNLTVTKNSQTYDVQKITCVEGCGSAEPTP